jgi:glycosyltransferase involved in cell wall biosynthesis
VGKALSVAWLGVRGFPNVQGGVETHAEHLCPLLVEGGCEVHVITRSPYHLASMGNSWKGVQLHRIWAPRSKGLEAIAHTFLGVLYAGLVLRPDILHIQAIGPAIMTPLARLLGLRVVVTHHGADYDRQKWGPFGRAILQLGERFGMRCSNARIVISDVIRKMVEKKHRRNSDLIRNGVVLPEISVQADALASFDLVPGKYVLLVSRLVPEKRHRDLIAAFSRAAIQGWKLAIVGGADHPDPYVQEVLGLTELTPGVVCTGLQTGGALCQLYSHAGIFVLPSSHEGLPIAMLEALSYGLPVIASNIPANLEVGLPPGHYFPLGNVEMLARLLFEFANRPLTDPDRVDRRSWVSDRYAWQEIAQQTLAVYRSIV